MLVKLFSGNVQAVEDEINAWITVYKPTVVRENLSSLSIGICVAVWYQDTADTTSSSRAKVRVRGAEKPGEPPICECGSVMVKRRRHSDGHPFWGCTSFPNCKGLVPFDDYDEEAERESVASRSKSGEVGYTDGQVEFGGWSGDDEGGDDDIPF